MAGGKDRAATLAFANEMERRVARERAGLCDLHEQQGKRPLVAHMAEFEADIARENTPHHVQATLARVRRIVDKTRVHRLADLEPLRV